MTKREREFVLEQARNAFYSFTMADLRGEDNAREMLLSVAYTTLNIAEVLLGHELVSAMQEETKELCSTIIAVEEEEKRKKKAEEEVRRAEAEKAEAAFTKVESQRNSLINDLRDNKEKVKKAAKYGFFSEEYQNARVRYGGWYHALFEMTTENDFKRIIELHDLSITKLDRFASDCENVIRRVKDKLELMKKYKGWYGEEYKEAVEKLREVVPEDDFDLILFKAQIEVGARNEDGLLEDWAPMM